jgi:hypothetical protein
MTTRTCGKRVAKPCTMEIISERPEEWTEAVGSFLGITDGEELM